MLHKVILTFESVKILVSPAEQCFPELPFVLLYFPKRNFAGSVCCSEVYALQNRAYPASREPHNLFSVASFSGAGAAATGRGPGKENQGQPRKQKKSKEDENKSGCSQMAENMAASLQGLNARLEEQQRQQRASMNGAASSSLEERSDESLTRHASSVFSDDSTSSHTPSTPSHALDESLAHCGVSNSTQLCLVRNSDIT